MNKSFSKVWPPLLPLLFAALVAELAVRQNWIANYLLPMPSEVLRCFFDARTELLQAASETAESSLAGLASSAFLGMGIAILLSLYPLLRRAFLPYAVFFQTVPIIAIAPLLVIWFGFGQPTVIVSAFIVSLFPVIAGTLLGLSSTDPALLDLFEIYGARTWQRIWKLRLPFALPQIFTGLRIAAGLAVIGAVVGEFVAGGGLGGVVDASRTQQRIDMVFAAVMLSALIGWLLVAGIDALSQRALKNWHASESGSE